MTTFAKSLIKVKDNGNKVVSKQIPDSGNGKICH